MKKLITIFRFILFIPAMILGGFFAVIAMIIWNIPLFFLDSLGGLFGNWNLFEFIFGPSKTSFSEILYYLSSGVFISTIGLYFAVSVFPIQRHRIKIAYFLAIWLLVGFSLSTQSCPSCEGNSFYLFSKILGIFIGSWVIIRLLKDNKQQKLFNLVDKMLD